MQAHPIAGSLTTLVLAAAELAMRRKRIPKAATLWKARYKAQARACEKRYCAGIGRRHRFMVNAVVGGTARLLY